MSNSPVDNVGNGWASVLISCAIGLFGATAISLCDEKIRRIALDTFSSIIPGFMNRKKPFVLQKQVSLVSEKKELVVPGGQSVLIRETAPNGDCFFLCAAIGLLEHLQQHQEYFPFIVDVIQKDSVLSVEEKERHISFLTTIRSLEDKDALELVFADNEHMNQMVLLLRSLMGSALEEEPDYEMLGDVLSAAFNKKQIYEEIDRVLGEDRGDISNQPTYEEYQKIVECIKQGADYVSTVIDCIRTNSLFSLQDKTSCIDFLTQSIFLEDKDQLKRLFIDNEKQVIILLNSLKPEESKVKVLSKENFYGEILGSLDKDPKARSSYPSNEEFTPEAFKKIVRLIRYSFSWPSDACIQALCKKLNIGFTIFQKEGRGFVQRTCVENLPSAGSLLLESNHYSKIYELPPFQVVRKFFGNVKDGLVEAIEIKNMPKYDVLFFSAAVALLDFLYKNKGSQDKFNRVMGESSECIALMNRVTESKTESDLQAVFKDIPSMNAMIAQLKSLVSEVSSVDIGTQAEVLCFKLGFPIKVGTERVSKLGELSVDPIYSPVNNLGLLLFQGQKGASFFPKK